MSEKTAEEKIGIYHNRIQGLERQQAIDQQTIADLNDNLTAAEEILKRVSEYGPPQGEKRDGIACAFCDMGHAGYAMRGDGFHDDKCAVKDAQIFLNVIEEFRSKK